MLIPAPIALQSRYRGSPANLAAGGKGWGNFAPSPRTHGPGAREPSQGEEEVDCVHVNRTFGPWTTGVESMVNQFSGLGPV